MTGQIKIGRRWPHIFGAGLAIALATAWGIFALHDGLTQPEATITTGILAILASCLAYLGVLQQISSNKQINEQNLTIEKERAQRVELLEVVRDATVGAIRLSESLIDLDNARTNYVLNNSPSDWDKAKYTACTVQLSSTWALLLALGHSALADQLFCLLDQANKCVKSSDKPSATLDERLALAHQWFKPFNEAWARMLTDIQLLLAEESLHTRPTDERKQRSH